MLSLTPRRDRGQCPTPQATNANSDTVLMQLWISGKSAATQSAYGTAIRQFEAFTAKELAAVGPEDVQAWVAQLQQHYAPESVRTKLHALKSLLSYAQRMGYLRYNDGCGLRVSEVCGLDWGDLQARDHGGHATVYGKERKTRVVLVPPKLWAALMQLPCRGKAMFASRSGQHLDARGCIASSRRRRGRWGLRPQLAPTGCGTRTPRPRSSGAASCTCYSRAWGTRR